MNEIRSGRPVGRARPDGAVLVLEGALSPGGAAVVAEGRIAACRAVPGGHRRRGDLFDAARGALDDAGAGPDDVRGIAVGLGPGSYTGVRVALAVARGLALASPRPLRVGGADSLAILARAARRVPPVTLALRWGRLRLLVARLGRDGSGDAAELLATDDLGRLAALRGSEVVVGEGASDLPWPDGVRLVPAVVTPLEALAELVLDEHVALEAGPIPEPSYLVAPDAVLPERAAIVPAGFELADLGPDDLADVVAIERRSFADPWSPGLLAEELEPRPDRLAIGLRGPGGRLAATVFMRFVPDAVWIISVATDPEFRRQGLARALVRRAVAEGRERGAERADLEVREGNEGALGLYRSEGFVPTGRRRGYYRGREDALLLSLVLRRRRA